VARRLRIDDYHPFVSVVRAKRRFERNEPLRRRREEPVDSAELVSSLLKISAVLHQNQKVSTALAVLQSFLETLETPPCPSAKLGDDVSSSAFAFKDPG